MQNRSSALEGGFGHEPFRIKTIQKILEAQTKTVRHDPVAACFVLSPLYSGGGWQLTYSKDLNILESLIFNRKAKLIQMSLRNIILFCIVAAFIGGGISVILMRGSDESSVQAEIEQLVRDYDDAVYLDGDYEAAKTAANKIVDLAEKSDVPNATEIRGLIRLAYLELAVGKWGNRWRKKVKRCDELVSQEPTIDRAEYLLYVGVINGKFRKNLLEEGIERVEEAALIADKIRDDRTLALAYTNLGELHNFAGHRNFVAGNSYRSVTIAKYHGQKSILVRSLRNLIDELVFLGNYSEAAACGREILKIEPQAQAGIFATFLTGKSDDYLHLVEGYLAKVKERQKNKSATNRDLMELGRALKKLAMGYAIHGNNLACSKYTKLAIPYLKMVGDDISLVGCRELLNVTKLDQADTIGEIDKIKERFVSPSEISMSALATAYARVGEFKKSSEYRELVNEAKFKRYASELGFIKQSSELFWDSKINSRHAEFSDLQAVESQRRVWLLSAALASGLTFCVLIGGFYIFLRRERNSLEEIVKNRTRSLSEAVEAASAADRAKSDFLSQINHEIRNPLTAILGYCDLLALSKEKSLEFIAGIESSSSHLRDLVDKILEVSKIESSGLELNNVNFLPAETTDDVNDIMSEQAIKKDLRFACFFRGDPTCLIFSDETKIRQIALNLTGNAIKFTDNGSVTVSFDLRKDEETLLIVVKDTGIGIAETETQTVFDRFAKASNGVACDGSGLGLFITSQLVNCLGGDIALKSSLGLGTQVTVSLPVKFSCGASLNTEAAVGHTDSENLTANLTPKLGKRIVLVDDQETIRTSMKLLLNANGMQCRTAQDLEQTMELIENWHPDLVLLDLRMPKHSGYEVFERIRRFASSNVPVYAMTGDATTKVKEKCINLGFDGFIIKPFKIKTIQEILATNTSVV